MARSTNLALLETRGRLGDQLVVKNDYWGDGSSVIISKRPDMRRAVANPTPAQEANRASFAAAVQWAKDPTNNAPFADPDGKKAYMNALKAYLLNSGPPAPPQAT